MRALFPKSLYENSETALNRLRAAYAHRANPASSRPSAP